jgi:hypothetical protein
MSWMEEARARREKREAEEAKLQAEDDAKVEGVTEYAWLCASTDPVRDRYANEMAGRKLHAIPWLKGETHGDLRRRRSVCGKKAKHGWCSDLFNTKCKRCMAKTGERDDR